MIDRGSLWLPLVILLVLAGLSFWIERSVQAPGTDTTSDKVDPEGIMEDFDALRTDALGNPEFRLSAARLKHYTGSKRTELESPRFIQIDKQAGELSAAARAATVSPDGNEVDLFGDVRVMREARPGQSAMTLTTARLLVYPERKLLRAPGAVEVTDKTMALHAGAMEYRAGPRIVKLTGRVKARYIAKAK
ncbi:MAG: LPS export ABC transporter periplasmic protein LptC [Thiobacillus sp.]|nr:LPS export ABC transporter periplasmic protein LptC [Thiobacillus sp.]